MIFFCGLLLPLYTSNMYESSLNVKKDSPTGKAILRSDCMWSMSIKNPVYL